MRWTVVCCLVPLFVALCPACGGSSSETPFPLEPDLSHLDAGPPDTVRYIVYQGKGAKPTAPEESEPTEDSGEAPRPAPPAH
ncbi:MAG: hypothetical protein IPI67_30840 [Myxococcales bacterium]|nr:hypothetical protein [Myxococcales bacterium]